MLISTYFRCNALYLKYNLLTFEHHVLLFFRHRKFLVIVKLCSWWCCWKLKLARSLHQMFFNCNCRPPTPVFTELLTGSTKLFCSDTLEWLLVMNDQMVDCCNNNDFIPREIISTQFLSRSDLWLFKADYNTKQFCKNEKWIMLSDHQE